MFGYRYVTVVSTVTYYERHLPHWQPAGKDVFVTWRLYGSLPPSTRILASSERSPSAGERLPAFVQAPHHPRDGPPLLKELRLASYFVVALPTSQEEEIIH